MRPNRHKRTVKTLTCTGSTPWHMHCAHRKPGQAHVRMLSVITPTSRSRLSAAYQDPFTLEQAREVRTTILPSHLVLVPLLPCSCSRLRWLACDAAMAASLASRTSGAAGLGRGAGLVLREALQAVRGAL